jgi:hypothetical protein
MSIRIKAVTKRSVTWSWVLEQKQGKNIEDPAPFRTDSHRLRREGFNLQRSQCKSFLYLLKTTLNVILLLVSQSDTARSPAQTPLWETRESKAVWRDQEGWISAADAEQVVKDVTFCYTIHTESFCTI